MLMLFGRFIIKIIFLWCYLSILPLIFDILDLDKERQIIVGSIITIGLIIHLYYLEL